MQNACFESDGLGNGRTYEIVKYAGKEWMGQKRLGTMVIQCILYITVCYGDGAGNAIEENSASSS